MIEFLWINNKEQLVFPKLSSTVLQQCEWQNIAIPRFCYHEKLSIAGNCRLCLVEINNSFKLVVSCATTITNNMSVITINDAIKTARENILELLLINHPLDCPICDQGGECDLQDQTLIYGRDRSKFVYVKRTVLDKKFSPFIKTIMTRCIHCTRCIRYFNEITLANTLGTIGRGGKTEISNYIKTRDLSELSGNVIDICPVGALTSRAYSATTRYWEVVHMQTIDLLDSFLSNIRLTIKNDRVVSVLPYYTDTKNNGLITNKIRFSYDSLYINRITTPKIRDIRTNILIDVSYKKVFNYLKYNIYKFCKTKDYWNYFYAYSGKFVHMQELLVFKNVCKGLRIGNVNMHIVVNNDNRRSYLTNWTAIQLLSVNKTQFFLFYGIELKSENAIYNLQIRKTIASINKIFTFYVGRTSLHDFKSTHIGLTMACILEFYCGASNLCKAYKDSTSATFFSSEGAFDESSNVTTLCSYIEHGLKRRIYTQFNNLFSGDISALELNITSTIYSKMYDKALNFPKFIYFFGHEDFEFLNFKNKNLFIIYYGSHLDLTAKKSNVLIPKNTFYEEDKALYMDCHGWNQFTNSIPTDLPLFKDLSDQIHNSNSFIYTFAIYLSWSKLIPFDSVAQIMNNKHYFTRIFLYITLRIDSLGKFSNSPTINYSSLILPTVLKARRIYRHTFLEDAIFSTDDRVYYSMDIFCKNSKIIKKNIEIFKIYNNNMLNISNQNFIVTF